MRCLRAPPWSNLVSFRGYPRLTAPIRGKTRLIASNGAIKFSGGFPRLIRGCTRQTATARNEPQAIAPSSTYLHEVASSCEIEKFAGKQRCRSSVAGVARSCTKKLFYFSSSPVADATITPSNGKARVLTPFKNSPLKLLRSRLSPGASMHIGKSSQLKANQGNYQVKPPIFLAHNHTHNPNLTPNLNAAKNARPGIGSQRTVNVGNYRRSKNPVVAPVSRPAGNEDVLSYSAPISAVQR